MGLLGQHSGSALSPDLALRDCVGLPLAVRGARRGERRRRAAELLEAAGLLDRAGALPHALSGGERQRAALCLAIAHRPALLLADEPTGELDAANGQAMLGLIGELARAEGTTVIVASHDPAAASAADRSVRMRDGRIVEEAPVTHPAAAGSSWGAAAGSRCRRHCCARPASTSGPRCA